ncbi:ABC transporter substrate-binding protein [Balneola sp. MJW-20]|uniref:ABC transporter substrate-binding protein n=1 Tax=Gracilimonas aurantiaca TaxID=3234185 RepID=UPI0034652ED7
MKNFIFIALSSVFLIISGCGSPETLIVESGSLTPDDAAYSESNLSGQDNGFQFLHLGEAAPIYSLDPLFASNNSELRILDLIYENLVTYGPEGNIIPELARRWEMTNDSLRYTFTIRPDVFFHNTDAFVSGIGRKLVANDVRRVFERMARSNVPDHAANMFSGIRGFETYKAELHQVQDPSRRVINNIDGIRVLNDSTVQVYLNEPDADFLTNLAHPLAAVYPIESTLASSGPVSTYATGTGRFYLVQKGEDRYILGANQDYYRTRPVISRLDITHGLSEKDLFDRFRNDELDALIEASPAILKTIADSNASLKPEYSEQFVLSNTGIETEYALYLNPKSPSADAVYNFSKSLTGESLRMSEPYLGAINVYPPDSTSNISETRQLVVANTSNPFESFLINAVAGMATEQTMSFSMKASAALTGNTTFTTRYSPELSKVFSWKIPVFILTKPNIEGLSISHNPWSLNTGRIIPEESL